MHLTPSGIRIGCATVPRQRITASQDATRLQAAMIDKPRGPDWYAGVVMAACALAFAVMAFAGWLPGAV
jgi:uncharacterized membrane protein YjjP (DUF1212 family)